MLEEAFEVATEFKFDVGQAIFNTDALKNSVNSLSQTADNALNSLHYLAGGLVAHLGLGSGGLLSMLTESVKLAESFHTGSMGFLNSIGSNMNVLSGHVHGFNEQLESSAMLMGKVNEMAARFGFNSNELAATTHLISSPMLQAGKGGTDYKNIIDLAKNSMLVGEFTGMGHQAASEAILRAMSPGGTLMGKMFERVVNSQAFRKAGIRHPQQFSMFNDQKRMDLLMRAMSELGNNAGYLSERLNSLTVVFNMIKNRISDVLGPIGEALRQPLLKILRGVSDFLGKNGKKLGDSIAALFGDIFKDPEKFLVNLLQLKEIGRDFHSAMHFTELVLTFRFLKYILNFIGIELKGGLLMAGFRSLFSVLGVIRSVIPFTTIFYYALKFILNVLSEFVPIWGSFMMLFQGLSRAKAQAHVSDAKDLVQLSPRIASAALQWKRLGVAILAPFQEIIQTIADIFEPIFKLSNMMHILVWITEKLAPAMEFLVAGFLGIAAGIHALVRSIKNDFMNVMQSVNNAVWTGKLGQVGKALLGMDKGKLDDNFMKDFDDYIDKNYQKLGKIGDSTSKSIFNTTNNINANFNLREQLEPDRVAFAVTTALKKVVLDRTQASGHSMHSGFVRHAGTVTAGG